MHDPLSDAGLGVPEGSPKTGWPPGMLQDDSRELSKWLAERPGARFIVDGYYMPEGRPLIPGQDATPNRLRKDRKCGINCVLMSLFLFCLLGAIASCVFNGGKPLL